MLFYVCWKVFAIRANGFFTRKRKGSVIERAGLEREFAMAEGLRLPASGTNTVDDLNPALPIRRNIP